MSSLKSFTFCLLKNCQAQSKHNKTRKNIKRLYRIFSLQKNNTRKYKKKRKISSMKLDTFILIKENKDKFWEKREEWWKKRKPKLRLWPGKKKEKIGRKSRWNEKMSTSRTSKCSKKPVIFKYDWGDIISWTLPISQSYCLYRKDLCCSSQDLGSYRKTLLNSRCCWVSSDHPQSTL